MDTLYKWIVELMYLLIPGLFYLTDVIFFLLGQLSIDIFALDIDYKDYTVILFVLIFLVSYIIGFSMNSASQKFIWWFKPDLREIFIQSIKSSENKINNNGGYFFSLIMVRHLLISTFLMGPVFLFYFSSINLAKLGYWLLLICFLFFVVHIFAYLQLRSQVNLINKVKKTSSEKALN